MGVREPSSVCPGMMFSLFGKRARDPQGLRLFEARLGGRWQGAGIVCGCPSRRAVLVRPFFSGHAHGREGLYLDESLWSRDPHLLEKRGDLTAPYVRLSSVLGIEL